MDTKLNFQIFKFSNFSTANILPLLFLMLLSASCIRPQVKLQKEIKVKESFLMADTSIIPERQKANDMIKLYINYADKFQDDTASGTYLFKAGDLAFKVRQPAQAVELFGRVQRYPTNQNVAVSLFLQGFIAETELNDKTQAKKYYESFLQKYPQHDLAGDVQITLANLGKSDEELVREFEEKLKAQEEAAR